MIWENKMAYNQFNGLGRIYGETFPVIDERVRNLFTAEELLSIKKIYALGDGDSYHAASASRSAFMNLTNAEYFPLPAMKFLACEIDGMRDYSPGQSLVVGISASGESRRVVQCLKRAREKIPDACFVAVTGNPESSLAKIAGKVFNVGLPDPELGSAPGFRTYAASLFGLTALAIRFGEIQNRYHMTEANAMRSRIAAQDKNVARIIEEAESKAASLRRFARSNFFMTAGSGNHFGSASFTAAKLTEIAGIFSVPQDLEEWMHVERFSYPLDTPLIVIAPKGASFAHAKTLMETAKKKGHPVIAVTDAAEDENIKSLAEIVFPVYGDLEEYFMQLLFYIPSVSMGVSLGNELGRAMFMTDNAAIQEQRAAMSQMLREDV